MVGGLVVFDGCRGWSFKVRGRGLVAGGGVFAAGDGERRLIKNLNLPGLTNQKRPLYYINDQPTIKGGWWGCGGA